MKVYLFLDMPDRPQLEIVSESDQESDILTKIHKKIWDANNLITPISACGKRSNKIVDITFDLCNFLNGRRFGNPGILEDLEAAIRRKK